MSADHSTHALGLGIEGWMPQKTADELCRVVVRHLEPDQAVIRVRPVGSEKVSIQTEERRLQEAMKNGDQVFVLRACRRHFNAHDAKSDPRFTQQLLLAGGQIFVEYQH